MHMKNASILVILITFFLQACATPYSGPQPNLSAKGDSAQLEYYRFRMDDSFWAQKRLGFHMGTERTLYTRQSLDPIIAEISPRALDELQVARHWETAQSLFFLVMMGGFIGSFANGSRDTPLANTLFWSGAGLSITCGMISIGMISKAASYYNEDLRSKLGIASNALPQGLQFSVAY